MTTTIPRYACAHCDETFTNPVKLGGHVHANHPGHKRRPPLWMRTERPARPARNLKRDTDTWPGKP